MAIEVKKDGDTDISQDPSAFTAVAADTPPGDAPEDAKYVTYHGKATLRRLTEEQWRQGGVNDQGYVEWSSDNGFRVSVEDLSADALEALRKDGNFSVPARNQE